MKRIEAVIRPSAFQAVHEALDACGIGGFTLTEVTGRGALPGVVEFYRGTPYHPTDLTPKVRLEIMTADALAAAVVNAIVTAARSGRAGDGIVMVQPVEQVLRIRTGERGVAAVAPRTGEHGVAPSRARVRARATRVPLHDVA